MKDQTKNLVQWKKALVRLEAVKMDNQKQSISKGQTLNMRSLLYHVTHCPANNIPPTPARDY